jgi:hypothetical protein
MAGVEKRVTDEQLRPVERRVRHLVANGMSEDEIARRFRRSPDWVRRVLAWSQVPRSAPRGASVSMLRPLERRVLHWRDQGADHAEIGSRFRRGRGFIEQVEHLAQYKLG